MLKYLKCNISAHRLGNALFMAASTIGIAKANGMHPLFPTNWKYRSYFNIPDEYFGDCKIEVVHTESHFHFTVPLIDVDKNTELIGYYQSERYFHHCKDEILEYLTPKGAMPSSIDVVAIHHRRGDYVGNVNYQQLGMDYYLSVYDVVRWDSIRKKVISFSDDINYISLHYHGNTFGLMQRDEMTDFVGIVACRYHICSNSTYSWWGAYLSGGMAARPLKYFDGPLAKTHDEKDFWPLNWLGICTGKVNLSDVTFIIPFTYDHEDRLNNINTVVKYLTKYFDTNIIIGEINTNKIEGAVKYQMPVFHRTKVLNDLTRRANTPYVFNWDADVLTSPWQIYKAVQALRNGADVCYPFKDDFACVPRTDLKPLHETLDVGVFAGRKYKYIGTYKSVGGAVGYNKESFFKAGGENEGFISYGPEDKERYLRFNLLGLKVEKIPGTIFHMEHWRGANSGERHPDAINNIKLFNIEKGMTPDEMRAYVDSDLWGTNKLPLKQRV